MVLFHSYSTGAESISASESADFPHAASREAHGPAIALKQLSADLPAELFRLVIATENEHLSLLGLAARQLGADLIGERAIQARREVQLRDRDAVVAIKAL